MNTIDEIALRVAEKLEQWATAKRYEATIVCRVAGINPTAQDTKGKP